MVAVAGLGVVARRAWVRSCASAARVTLMWSAAVFDPVARAQRHREVQEHHSRVVHRTRAPPTEPNQHTQPDAHPEALAVSVSSAPPA